MLREVKLLTGLRHANILPVIDIVVSPGTGTRKQAIETNNERSHCDISVKDENFACHSCFLVGSEFISACQIGPSPTSPSSSPALDADLCEVIHSSPRPGPPLPRQRAVLHAPNPRRRGAPAWAGCRPREAKAAERVGECADLRPQVRSKHIKCSLHHEQSYRSEVVETYQAEGVIPQNGKVMAVPSIFSNLAHSRIVYARNACHTRIAELTCAAPIPPPGEGSDRQPEVHDTEEKWYESPEKIYGTPGFDQGERPCFQDRVLPLFQGRCRFLMQSGDG